MPFPLHHRHSQMVSSHFVMCSYSSRWKGSEFPPLSPMMAVLCCVSTCARSWSCDPQECLPLLHSAPHLPHPCTQTTFMVFEKKTGQNWGKNPEIVSKLLLYCHLTWLLAFTFKLQNWSNATLVLPDNSHSTQGSSRNTKFSNNGSHLREPHKSD